LFKLDHNSALLTFIGDSFGMFWPDGRRASAHCSFVHAFRQWAEVLGANGTLTLDDFVLPKSSHQVVTVSRHP
jgi:hypothetical protein